MLLNGNKPGHLPEKNPVQQNHCYFDAGIASFLAGNASDAFLFFSSCDKNEAAVAVNLACCLLRAGKLGVQNADVLSPYGDAEQLLRSASGKLAPLTLQTKYLPTVRRSSAYRMLHQFEQNDNSYQMPVPRAFAQLFPDILKERIERILVDIYVATGQRDKLQTAVNALSGKGFANVAKAKEMLQNNFSEE